MTIGANICLGPGQGASASLSSHAIINGLQPYDWWDFTDADSLTLTGSSIDAIANKGTNTDAISKTAGTAITYDSGKGVCGGVQNSYYAGAAASHNFLHNGAGAEVYFVILQNTAATEQNLIVSNDMGQVSFNEGIRFSTYQFGGNKHYAYRVGYGASHLSSQSSANTLTIGSVMISSIRIYSDSGSAKDIAVFENETELVDQSDGGLLSSSDHAVPLRLLTSFTGDIYGILIFNRQLQTAERTKLFVALQDYYPVA